MSAGRALLAALAALLIVFLVPPRLAAQAPPNGNWRTLRTAHFDVSFLPALEPVARRAAAEAEAAYARLAARLRPPRGRIALVVADNVDASNGFTTPFPTNRITIYASPGIDVPSLRFYDDWLQVLLTHELTHSFQLDRVGGWWKVAQHIFGRAPVFFPNLYQPAWIAEGLAVYFESDLTHAGRVASPWEHMLLQASVLRGGLPRFGAWSLATTRYPGGDIAYGYGGLFLDWLARTRGDTAVAAFIRRSTGAPIPYFMLNRAATRAFGTSFSDAWRAWRDALAARAPDEHSPLAGWRDLTHRGYTQWFPRWLGDTAVLYAANEWVDVAGLYRADTGGRVSRVARRNVVDVNAPRPDGTVAFTQLDFTDPYHLRSDLYVGHGRAERRLTRGARLTEVDVRRDGALVAVRLAPGTNELVRLAPDGRLIAVLAPAALDTQWNEPRWSPDGTRIAVTRWTRGGFADIVVLDTTGVLVARLTNDRAFDASPSWTPDARAVLFSSDRAGTSDVWIAPADGSAPARRITRDPIGIFYPSLSADGRTLAASRYAVDGFHIGIAPFDTANVDAPPLDSTFDAPPIPPAGSVDVSASPYRPWGSLLPHYWLPLVGQNTRGQYTVGAFTSGSDVIGRHSYYAQALYDPSEGEHTADVSYRYAGFGQPLVDAGASQDWSRATIVHQDGSRAGTLHRRRRTASLGLTVQRPRIRNSAFASLSGELEDRRYTTEPGGLIDSLSGASFYTSNPRYWSMIGEVGWSNARYPVLAISPENGLSVDVEGRLRWLDQGRGLQSRSVVAALDGYRALPLGGGFAHHVLAARIAGAVASGPDPREFDIGGASGSYSSLLPGLSVGSRYTFGVRGFPSGARSGSRAAAGSLEYRMPLFAPRRGAGFFPVFLDRTSLSLFADAGSAWGPAVRARFSDAVLASVGAELNLDLALQYDVPYRVRLGIAAPVVDRSYGGASPVSVYVRLGLAF